MFMEFKNHENFSLYRIVYTQQLLCLDVYIYICRYREDQVPPHTSSKSRQGAGRISMCCHASCPARGSSGAATCPVGPAPAVRPGAAPGPPRVLRAQLPLSGPGQLRGRHVSCGTSSRCLARGSSDVVTCPAASTPATQPGAAPRPPRVPWRPNGRRAIKVADIP
jgi:hypothetical protein